METLAKLEEIAVLVQVYEKKMRIFFVCFLLLGFQAYKQVV